MNFFGIASWYRERYVLGCRYYVLLLIIAGSCLFLFCCTPQDKAAPPSIPQQNIGLLKEQYPYKVLLVHSYHKGYPWVDAITRGVRMALSGEDVGLEVFYMDTKRHTDELWKEQAGEMAAAIVREWAPTVVIAVDDNAQSYFVSKFINQEVPQFVFCGVNERPERYGYPRENVTGILERPHYGATVELLRKLVPDAKRIAFVSDDSPTSAGALLYIREKAGAEGVVLVEQPETFAEWKEAITHAQEVADAIAIYMYHTVQPHRGGQSMEAKEVMRWTVSNSEIPVLGFFTFAVDDGALCGFVESGVEQGRLAGKIARDMLAGKKASKIPIVQALEGQSMLNLESARRLNITVDKGVLDSIDIVKGE